MAPPALLSALALVTGGFALRKLLGARAAEDQTSVGTSESTAAPEPSSASAVAEGSEQDLIHKFKQKLESRIEGWDKLATDLEQFPYYLRYALCFLSLKASDSIETGISRSLLQGCCRVFAFIRGNKKFFRKDLNQGPYFRVIGVLILLESCT